MHDKTSIYQTCTASQSTIGISVYLVNNIGTILVALLLFSVVAVMVRLAIVKRQRVRDLKSAKKEAVLFNGDTLSRIVSFLPSIDLPSLALTCKRFGLPEEGELSLHDEALFRQPPPKEDCQICELRLPTLVSGRFYMTCCGKDMCGGCFYASFHENQGNEVDNPWPKCPFCRIPMPTTEEENNERLKKRVENNDAVAMSNLGCYYRDGQYGFPQDNTKALELWQRAAELGHVGAYFGIGCVYYDGRGVDEDKKKAKNYYELAAMRGDSIARHNLGFIEYQRGNTNRALKHYLIAVKDGYDDGSLTNIKRLYKSGQATKDEYTKSLQLYQTYLDEIKSDQRDQAAAANDKHRYY